MYLAIDYWYLECLRYPRYAPDNVHQKFVSLLQSILTYHSTLTCSQDNPYKPTNSPLLYTSAIFHLPIFTYNHPNNLHQNIFPTSAI